MTRPRAAWCVLIAFVVTGCATPAPNRARIATGIAERTGVDAKGLPLPTAKWTLPPGTAIADGLSIDEAVAIALWNNPDFQVALASLGFARADLIEAGMLKNPVFSLLFPLGPKQLEFTVTWAIDALWQRPKRIAGARLNADSIAEQLVGNGLKVVADVRIAFYEALLVEQRLAFATEQASVAAQVGKLAEGQFRAGDISEFDARLASTEVLRLEAVRLTRVTARDLALVRLRSLLGLRPSDPELKLLDPPAMNGQTCEAGPTLLASALAARPDVRAAELQIEAAGARAGLERSRIQAITASLDANAKGSQGFEMGPGLAVELPILSQNQGGRARAAAEVEQASRRYVAVRAAVGAEIDAALVALTEARNTARLLGGDVAASLSGARKQAEGLYAAGEISLLDFLHTRQRLIDIEVTRADTAFGVDRAVVRLEQAIGRTCGSR